MSQKKPWDLTSTHALEAAAEWIRKRAGALAVVIVRVDDAVLSVDPQMTPRDADGLVCERMRELARGVDQARREKRQAESLRWDALRE